MPKKLTIDDLARMTAEEFTASRKYLDQQLGETEARIHGTLDIVVSSLDLMRDDLRDIKIALGPLSRSVIALEEEVRNLTKRVERLEEGATH